MSFDQTLAIVPDQVSLGVASSMSWDLFKKVILTSVQWPAIARINFLDSAKAQTFISPDFQQLDMMSALNHLEDHHMVFSFVLSPLGFIFLALVRGLSPQLLILNNEVSLETLSSTISKAVEILFQNFKFESLGDVSSSSGSSTNEPSPLDSIPLMASALDEECDISSSLVSDSLPVFQERFQHCVSLPDLKDLSSWQLEVLIQRKTFKLSPDLLNIFTKTWQKILVAAWFFEQSPRSVMVELAVKIGVVVGDANKIARGWISVLDMDSNPQKNREFDLKDYPEHLDMFFRQTNNPDSKYNPRTNAYDYNRLIGLTTRGRFQLLALLGFSQVQAEFILRESAPLFKRKLSYSQILVEKIDTRGFRSAQHHIFNPTTTKKKTSKPKRVCTADKKTTPGFVFELPDFDSPSSGWWNSNSETESESSSEVDAHVEEIIQLIQRQGAIPEKSLSLFLDLQTWNLSLDHVLKRGQETDRLIKRDGYCFAKNFPDFDFNKPIHSLDIISQWERRHLSNEHLLSGFTILRSLFRAGWINNSFELEFVCSPVIPEALESTYFEVAESTLPGTGQGLFARRNLPAGVMLGYRGRETSKKDYGEEEHVDYGFTVGNGTVINALDTDKRTVLCLAARANHAEGAAAKFISIETANCPEAPVHLLLKEACPVGTELTLDYGPQFWEGREKPVTSPEILRNLTVNPLDIFGTQTMA